MNTVPFTHIINSFVQKESIHEYTVGEDWMQGRTIFGGVIAALANDSMRRFVGSERPLRAMQIVLGGPNPPGTLQLHSEVLREGKAITLARCTISSNGQISTTINAIYGAARESKVYMKMQNTPPALKPEECIQFEHIPEYPNFLIHFQQCWALNSFPYTKAKDTHQSIYSRYAKEEVSQLTEAHMIALLDNIPPPALAMLDGFAPASTMCWTVDFLEHDFSFATEDWWHFDSVVDSANEGYVVHTSHVINPAGNVAAISRQVVAVYG